MTSKDIAQSNEFIPHVSLRRAILIRSQLEQLLRILPPNLQSVRIRHLSLVKPFTSIGKRLKRIIDREQNSIRADLRHTKVQGRRREMPRGCNPQVLRKVLADRLLTRLPQTKQLFPVLEPVVDPPHVEWDVLAQMTENNLQFGVAVEDSVRDHSEDVQTYTLCE